MRTAIAQSDHHPWVGDQLGDAILIRVEEFHRELHVEVVFEREIEEGVDAIATALTRDFGDRLAEQRLGFGFLELLDLEPLPLAVKDRRPLKRLAERGTELRIAI